MARPTFTEACAQYPHRYTMTHIPAWARTQRHGTYSAPQYRDCREWYANTKFPGESGYSNGPKHCYSTNPSWPLGQSLKRPPAEVIGAAWGQA